MLSLKQNPAPLSPAFQSVSDIPGDWWIAHVKARNEKALAHDLAAAGIGYYLPMTERETYSGNRRRRNLYPLFTSYLFFAGTPEHRYQVLTTNRVANILEVHNRDTLVRELTDIEHVINAGDTLELVPSLPIGRRVEVIKGPFQGTLGVVTGNRPWNAITLTIDVLGVGAELKINGDLLELVSENSEFTYTDPQEAGA